MDRFLYDNEERYHRLMDSAPHLIASINEDGKIIDCNDKISEILGYNRSEVIGLSMLDLITPKFHAKAVESWNGGYLKDFMNKENFIMIRKDQTEIEVRVNLARITAADGEKSIRIWVIEEISKQIETQRDMFRNNVNSDVYLDILGHDIQNLTQVITSYSELLLMKPNLSKQYKKYFETTMHHSRTISDLMSNVKHLSQLKNDNFEIKDIDVFKVLASAIDRIQQDNPYRSLKVNQAISEFEVIVKSSDMLEHALINLINNVLKYEKHKEITLDISHSLDEDNAYWKLEFKDYGPGIPDSIKDKVFDNFEIGNEYNHGSGLGLTLVKEIVTRSGGRVWVENRVVSDFSQGSNFIMLLPKAD